MLVELSVSDLGLIEQLNLSFAPGMTALTGETGAGKTLLVEAIELLVGGRADPLLVRHGATEATVEGRFVNGDQEFILRRVLPASGRSRAYIDGQMATAGALSEAGRKVVDLHGQHDHQSLLSAAVQREALDRFGGIDLTKLSGARACLAEIDKQLADLGGDAGARSREIDLLRFQSGELAEAGLLDPDEDEQLDLEETTLGDALEHRTAGASALEALRREAGASESVATAISALSARTPYVEEESRLRSVAAELADLTASVRDRAESISDDPQRLAAIGERRQRLNELRRKYGNARQSPQGGGTVAVGSLADVIAYRDEVRDRLNALDSWEARAEQLGAERAEAVDQVRQLEKAVGRARRKAAPALASAVQGHLAALAMTGARIAINVGEEDPGDQVSFLLAANVGAPPLPLSKVASGGELARTMLALRLVLSAAPPCLIFDEVDAGIGGTAALAVGRALAALGRDHQVLVVTHLPQVAAYADRQVSVRKTETKYGTRAGAEPLDADGRVVELSRMLSGTPESSAARRAAAELLEVAATERSAGA